MVWSTVILDLTWNFGFSRDHRGGGRPERRSMYGMSQRVKDSICHDGMPGYRLRRSTEQGGKSASTEDERHDVPVYRGSERSDVYRGSERYNLYGGGCGSESYESGSGSGNGNHDVGATCVTGARVLDVACDDDLWFFECFDSKEETGQDSDSGPDSGRGRGRFSRSRPNYGSHFDYDSDSGSDSPTTRNLKILKRLSTLPAAQLNEKPNTRQCLLSKQVRDSIQNLTIYVTGPTKLLVNISQLLDVPNLRSFRVHVLAREENDDTLEQLEVLETCLPLSEAAKSAVDLQLSSVEAFNKLSVSYMSTVRSLLVYGSADGYFRCDYDWNGEYNPGKNSGVFIINSWIQSMENLQNLEFRLTGNSIPVLRSAGDPRDKTKTWLWKSTFDKLTRLKALTVLAVQPFLIFSASYLQKVTTQLSLTIYWFNVYDTMDEITFNSKFVHIFPHVTCFVLDVDIKYRPFSTLHIEFPNGLTHLEIKGALSGIDLAKLIEHSPNLLSLTGAYKMLVSDAELQQESQLELQLRLGFVRNLCPRIRHLRVRGDGDPGDIYGRLNPSYGEDRILYPWDTSRMQNHGLHFSNTLPELLLGTLRDLPVREAEEEDNSTEEQEYEQENEQQDGTLSGNMSFGDDSDFEQALLEEIDLVSSQCFGPALTFVNSLAGLRDLETLTVYFPYDILTQDVYRRLMQQHPKLRMIYLLYRPDSETTRGRGGIFEYTRAMQSSMSSDCVYEVDVAGYRALKSTGGGGALRLNKTSTSTSCTVKGKCFYCVCVGNMRLEDYV